MVLSLKLLPQAEVCNFSIFATPQIYSALGCIVPSDLAKSRVDSIHLTLVFCTDKADFCMHVISVPVHFRSHAALSNFRCSFFPALPLPRWFLISPATSPMLRWYKISPAPSQLWRGCRICPTSSQVRRGYRTCPTLSPMQRESIVSSASDHCGQTILQNTVVACNDVRDIF